MNKYITRALSETVKLSGIMYSLVVSLIGLAYKWRVDGEAAMRQDLNSYISYALIPGAISLLLIFLYHLRLAPLILRIETLESEKEALKDDLKHANILLKSYWRPLEEVLTRVIRVEKSVSISVFEPKSPYLDRTKIPMFSRGGAPRSPIAYLIFNTDTYDIQSASNISSITEHGLNDISLNFITPISTNYTVSTPGSTWKQIRKAPNELRIKLETANSHDLDIKIYP